MQTGSLKTKKAVDHVDLQNQKTKTIAREKRFKDNYLKLLKFSPADLALNYDVVYPDTQEDIKDLLHTYNRDKIRIEYFEGIGLKFVYTSGKNVLVGQDKGEAVILTLDDVK